MANARKTALDALNKLEKDDGYSNIVIDKQIKKDSLERMDAAFATALFYGVLERRITLDYIIARYSKQPLKKMSLPLKNILRTGVFQLKYMDKVPDNAAVNETVKLAKISGFQRASGFVNAVLRSFIRDEKQIFYPESKIERISVEYSCPEWIVKSFSADYGEENCKAVLKGFLDSDYLSVRVNTTKISCEEYIKKLAEDGVCAEKSPLCENAVIIKNSGSVDRLFGFDEGYFHVQDIASQICAYIVNAKPGQRVLDICAAPGGKSFTVAENMNDIGEVFALDLYEHKVKLIRAGAKRLGLTSVKSYVNDAKKYSEKFGLFDKVLCDLPCSGLGILGKKPEIRYKNVAFLDKLDSLQYDLLCESSKYVKPGGELIYSTCTLRNKENRDVAEKFLKNHPEFRAEPITADIPHAADEPENMLTLMPHIHKTDGFFVALFKRTR